MWKGKGTLPLPSRDKGTLSLEENLPLTYLDNLILFVNFELDKSIHFLSFISFTIWLNYFISYTY